VKKKHAAEERSRWRRAAPAMTSLERVRRALRHEETDRVPRLLYGEAIGYVPAIAALLQERCAPHSPREYFDMDIEVRLHGAGRQSLGITDERGSQCLALDFSSTTILSFRLTGACLVEVTDR